MLRCLLLVTVVLTSGACAHQVTVTSNVPDAHVRVDGERLGLVKDGATFVERGGIGATYDIEVVADGYVTKRQIVKPSEIDPWVGIPTSCLAVGSCAVAGCGAPLFALYGITTEQGDTTGQIVGYGIAGGLIGTALGAIAIASWGVERLPDVVLFDLVPVGEELPIPTTSLPMPAQSVTKIEPTPEPAAEAPPAADKDDDTKPATDPAPATTPEPAPPAKPATPEATSPKPAPNTPAPNTPASKTPAPKTPAPKQQRSVMPW